MGSGSSARVMSDAQFSAMRKYACVFCENLLFCPKCGHYECRLGYALREVRCKRFVRNVDIHDFAPWELAE